MAYILNIETATKVCSVALTNWGKVVAFRENVEEVGGGSEKYSHAELLTVYIQEILAEGGIAPQDLKAVALSQGPGSYTGLRIGASTAKGLCYALDIPLIAVNTLKSMVHHIRETRDVSLIAELYPNLLLCPMIDARRMEVYSAFYTLELEEYRATQADIIDGQSYREILAERPVLFFGDGMAKCKPTLFAHSGTYFIDDFYPSAKGMLRLSLDLFRDKVFEDKAYFEPYYLKEFQGTVAKKMV